ncbi:MAG: hypothetical protein NT028_06960 [candidate division Zixibacteria bacterium]|nr:hypothetical protein [candidate division Zixibacteria bacterium]
MSVFLRISFVVAAAIIFLTTAMSTVQGAPTQSYRSGAILSGTDGTCKFYKPGDSTWMYSRFTYLMAYADCPGNIGQWRTGNPNCRIVFYTSGTDLDPFKSFTNNYPGSGKSTYIRNRMVQLGDIEENAYLHFYNDTKIRNWVYATSTWDTLLIPGTNSMTITAKDSVSRAINSYTTYLFTSRNTYTYPTRLAPNYTNAKMRLAYKEYVTFAFTSARTTYWPNITGYWDGMFFDNYNPGGIQGSHLVSGGLVVESGTAPANLLTYGTDAYGAWGWELMKVFGREVRDTLRTSAQWSADGKKKVLAYNAGLTWKNELMYPDSSGADALCWEYGFNPVNSPNNSIWRLENIYTHDSIATLNGATYFWISIPSTDYATKQQSIYNNLCFYYVARTDSTWMAIYPTPGNSYGAFYNPGYDTLSWIPAMGYELGVPIAHYQLATSGASPDKAGASYKVWMRDYQGGRVYIRPKDDLDLGIWGSASTPVTVSLGGTYQQLNTDGTLGSVITSLSLHGAEGAIVIPATTGACATPPSVPTLGSPADSAKVASRTPSLCVNNSTQSGSCTQPIVYHFQVSIGSSFSAITSENSSVSQGTSTTCWQVSTTLGIGQLYYWRVRAGNGTSWSNWSATRKFVTPNSAPTVPTLSSPANAATVTSVQPTLTVTNSTDPDGTTPTYHFQVSTASSFTTIAVENLSVAQGSGSTSWLVGSALSNLTTYYWRVRAYDGVAYSSWSSSRSFYVNQPVANNPPTVPTLSTPANGATMTSRQPTLVIVNSTDPEGTTPVYHFQLSTLSSFSSIAVENLSVAQGPSTTTWQVTPALNNLTTYYWRVRASDGQAYSGWSGSRSFYVNQPSGNNPPTVPTCSSPTSGAKVSSLTPDLIINNATDPNGDPLTYQFELYNASFSTLISQSPMITQGIGSTTPWRVPVTLSQKTTYTWRARAYDSQAWSNWMTLASFRTNRPPWTPIPRTPVNDTVFGSVHVLVTNNTTDPDGDTLTYDFVVYSDSLLTKYIEAGQAIPQGANYTSFSTGSSYTNNKPYWWRVRAFDGGAWCNYSAPTIFWHLDMALDAADAPTLVSPADGSTETDVKPQFHVTWSGSSSSVCQFELAIDADFSTIIDGGSVIGDQGAAVWTANRPLENGKTYFWRVKREQSGYSEGAAFSVSANIFLSPNPFSYLDGVITIHNLPPASRFEVYTPSGEKVVELDNLSGDYAWNVLNSSGEKLGSGVFLYYIRFNDKTVADKFIVVR